MGIAPAQAVCASARPGRNPNFYFRKRLLVVGGRNSAVEAALRCWRAGSRVTLSYRRSRFDERIVKGHILPDLEAQIKLGTIGFLPETRPLEITPAHIVLEHIPDGEQIVQPADFVLLNTGFVADPSLFEMASITIIKRRTVCSKLQY